MKQESVKIDPKLLQKYDSPSLTERSRNLNQAVNGGKKEEKKKTQIVKKRKLSSEVVTYTKKQIKADPKLEKRLKKSRIRAPSDPKNSERRSFNAKEAYGKTLAFMQQSAKKGKTSFTLSELIAGTQSFGFSFWSVVNSSVQKLEKEGKVKIEPLKDSRSKYQIIYIEKPQ